jgi:hypothetical protein
MALNPAVFYSAFQANRLSGPFPLLGLTFESFSLGLSQALSLWMVGQPQNLALQGVATGTAGSGTILAPTTRLVLAPNPALIQTSLSSAGVNGPVALSISSCVALGLSQAITSLGQYQGVSPTVGVGLDTSLVSVNNPLTLIPILQSLLGVGPSSALLSSGLSFGISSMLQTMTGLGSITGPTSPIASTGISISTLI